jgi:probable DNA metabolism protein
MSTLVYDGTFEGLLCLLDEVTAGAAIDADIGIAGCWQPSFFDAGTLIATDAHRAQRFLKRLLSATSRAVVKNVVSAHIADVPAFETTLAAYCRLAFARGAHVDRDHTQVAVQRVHALARSVAREVHRLKGFARFRELRDGSLFAPLQPTHNVIGPLAVYFTRRIPRPAWILYDVGRGWGLRWDCRTLTECTLASDGECCHTDPAALDELVSDAERRYQDLWRTFFRAISITSRENPQLQRQNMPARYWRFLIEQPGPIAAERKAASSR